MSGLHRCARLMPAFLITIACTEPGASATEVDSAPIAAAETASDVTKARLELRKGDHIAIIGNTLADRMQHDGWLETLLHARFPNHELTIRNLGYSGDEVGGYTARPDFHKRLRSASFGPGDYWLGRVKADVIFAFFGYNESFAGEQGLPKFRADLASFIQHARQQKYNDRSPPRLVLFSPIAHENLRTSDLPAGRENNQRLQHYTNAMIEIAAEQGVLFVDLLDSTRKVYAPGKQLTINGVHLNGYGDFVVADIIVRELFGSTVKSATGQVADRSIPPAPPAALKKLRQAVLDKNLHWFNRYRTLDGYSIYGGRADLRFTAGQTNRVVMDREMQILDIMTANRDKHIWATSLGEASGVSRRVDDSNLPDFIPVITNKPGAGPGGLHLFLDGEAAIKQMTVAKGMKVNLFASEREFPDVINPVQMAFDTKGRLWIAAWPTYPHWKPTEPMNDKLLILEDTNGDGKADKCTVFADGLHCPTGFEFWNGGVLLAQAPGLVFLKDTNGDDKSDLVIRVLEGIDSADTHHTANSFTFDPGGALYFQEGTFHHTQVETPYGPPVRNANAGVFRYEPRTQKFDVYITYPFANPHGHVFDRWGQDIVIDGTGAVPYHAALFSGRMDYPQKHAKPPQVYQQRTRPCPAAEILSSRHFPPEYQGNLLVPNVIGFQGILQYRIDEKGASYAGTEVEPVVVSTDPNFRPADVEIGPDGAIYFTDWHNPIIGHMQHNLRDPNRNKVKGRVYRVTYEGRDLLKPAAVAGAPIEKLLDLLKEPEDRVRYRARIELSAHPSDQVIGATKKWLAALDRQDPNYEHHKLEGLWVHQQHNIINLELLQGVLASPDHRARAAATRVLCYWRDRVPEALELFRKQAADAHPLVRLEAIRAASFFNVPEAIEVVLLADDLPSDQYLDYTRGETVKVLEPIVKRALAEGRKIAFTVPAGFRYLLRTRSIDELLNMERTTPVCMELLLRAGVRDEARRAAVQSLAKHEGKTETAILLDALHGQDHEPTGRREPSAARESMLFDLVRLLTSRPAAELVGVRADFEKMALAAQQPLMRQLGFVALIAADGNVERAWELSKKSSRSLQDLVSAMPLIRDPGQRAGLYPKVEPLLNGLPKEMAVTAAKQGRTGRYVRIELPGRGRTLTLAEVEVYSDGRNVARQGRATQKNTASGGDASKAIDGNTSGIYAMGGQTHTEENTNNAWWEVDLGQAYPIDSIVIFNRTEEGLGKRLDGFTVKILDNAHNVVYQQVKQPAPARSVVYEIGNGNSEGNIRRAAMLALTSVRGQEGPTFKALAKCVADGVERHAAIIALQRIPSAYWPQEDTKPLLENIVAYVRKLPAAYRTSPEALDALQLADALASRQALGEAKRIRKELGELGVRILRLGTVTDQMLFDKERLAVQSGKPVEIVFENTDLMPHNVVITQPGALEEIGTLAEASATQPGALERHYVPESRKIILGSRLLQPRDAQRLNFTAPKTPGVYPYVCTYPGHWRRMFGALYVVNDLDEYLLDPEGYLSKNPLPMADELLKYNRPRKEWKLEELASAVEQLDHGRSFANGKQMFQIANCVACHKLNGVGLEMGPDLAKPDPKLTRLDILKDILDPSQKINEKFYTYVFELQSGKQITGLILEENSDIVKAVENPLIRAEPLVIKKTEIASRQQSKTSIMPKGLLDKLTREEILDLIAYVLAKGDATSTLFQGGGHDGHGH